MLKILKAPHPVLSQKAKPVNKIDKTIITLLDGMKEALSIAKDPIGVGLAAPQVGVALDIFITKLSPDSTFQIFINPKVVKKTASKLKPSTTKHKKLEGCLSLQDIWGEVQRTPEIEVEFLDETGKHHKKKFKGFMSTVIQHETDHLSGILFPRRVLEQKGTLYKSEKDEKGEDVFDELKI